MRHGLRRQLADVVMLGWKEIEPFYYPESKPADPESARPAAGAGAVSGESVNPADARIARLWNMRKGLPDLGLPYAGYVYWTCGYWISKAAARRLVDAFIPSQHDPYG